MTPKTNWKQSDYFNLEDYNRITENLNLAEVRGGYPLQAFPQQALGNLISYNTYLMILKTYNALFQASSWESLKPIPNRQAWFNWQELNSIEKLCATALDQYENANKYGNGQTYGTNQTLGGGYFG